MLKDAKSLLIFVHGENLPALITNARSLLDEMEKDVAWEDNCISVADCFEWDSSKERHTTLSSFLEQ